MRTVGGYAPLKTAPDAPEKRSGENGRSFFAGLLCVLLVSMLYVALPVANFTDSKDSLISAILSLTGYAILTAAGVCRRLTTLETAALAGLTTKGVYRAGIVKSNKFCVKRSLK